MNEPVRLRYANQIVGLFLLLVLVLCCLVAVRLFTRIAGKKDRFYIDVSEDVASQLRTGTEVIILGETVGEVAQLSYVDGGDLVRVALAVDSRRSDLITTESEVELERKYGVGPPVVRIGRSRAGVDDEPPRPILPGGKILRFRQDEDQVQNMADTVETAGGSVDTAAQEITKSLRETVQPAFSASQKSFDSVRETSETLRPQAVETLAQLRETTVKLESELTQLTQRVDQLVDGDIRNTIDQINASAVAAAEAAESVRELSRGLDQKSAVTAEDVARTLQTLRETALQIQQLTSETRDVVRIVRSEAEELPGTTARVNDTVNEASDLVDTINDHWLLRRYQRSQQPSRQLPPSSIRGGAAR
jgi:ABC-type transporter Mla subunit MlaD